MASTPEEIPLPRAVVRLKGRGGGNGGRPSKLTDEVAQKITEAVSNGSYYVTACRAVGVDYTTLREWVVRGEADLAAGRTASRYAKFADALARAEAECENGIATTLARGGDGKFSDWRAQAVFLERHPRYRERWGPPKQVVAPGVTLQLSKEQTAALVEALRIGTAKPVEQQPIDPDDDQRQ